MTAQSTLVKIAFSLAAGVSAHQAKQDPMPVPATPVQSQIASASVYQAVSSKVSAFEARLSEMELENKQKLTARQTEFDAKLKAQREANAAMTGANADLKREVVELRQETADLRDRAQQIQKDNVAWKQDYEGLQANLTIAMELTSNTLTSITTDEGAQELNVLAELEELDRKQSMQSAHASRFAEIVKSNKQMSLLSTITNGVENPRSILKVLDEGINDMADEYERKKKDLDGQYAKLFSAEKSQHEQLVEEQESLSKQKLELTELKGKLNAAVNHLQATNEKLAEKGRAIRLYAQRLGIRSMPPQHAAAATSARKAEVTPHEHVEEQQQYQGNSSSTEESSATPGQQSREFLQRGLASLLSRR